MNRIVANVLGLLVLSACASQNRLGAAPDFTYAEAKPALLIMAPAADLALVELSGERRSNPEWSAIGAANLQTALADRLTRLGFDVAIEGDGFETATERAMSKLQVFDQDLGASETGFDPYDWNLETPARPGYALFVSTEGDFASSGHLAADIVVGALLGGFPPPTKGYGETRAALVDLSSGDAVWVGRNPRANIRTESGAREVAHRLLKSLPAPAKR